MKVAVTGATGFIGVPLVRSLLSAGHSVIAISRDPAKALARLPGADAIATREAETAFPAVDAVIHLAGETVEGRWTTAKKQAIRETRVAGTRRLVEAIGKAAHRPAVLVSASAVGIYGDRGDERLDERSKPGRGFLADVCVGWEAMAMQAANHGVRVAVLRTGLVFGKGGGALAPLLTTTKFGISGPMGRGRQWWPWIHIDDVIGLYRHALDTEITGPMNAVGTDPLRQIDIARAIGSAMHRPAIAPAPSFALYAILGEFASELLASRRTFPAAAVESGYHFAHTNLKEALRTVI